MFFFVLHHLFFTEKRNICESRKISFYFQNDEIILMRLFAHNYLGPRIYATFQNGIAYEYVAGKNLDYELAVDRNVYPLVATKGR